MADIKDKVVTAESLKALHDYNQKTYLPMVNPEVVGDLSVSGNGNFTGNIQVTDLHITGETILSPNQYGDELPAAGIVGRIFFKRLVE